MLRTYAGPGFGKSYFESLHSVTEMSKVSVRAVTYHCQIS